MPVRIEKGPGNFGFLPEGESISDGRNEIVGPALVRLLELEGKFISIQGEGVRVFVEKEEVDIVTNENERNRK